MNKRRTILLLRSEEYVRMQTSAMVGVINETPITKCAPVQQKQPVGAGRSTPTRGWPLNWPHYQGIGVVHMLRSRGLKTCFREPVCRVYDFHPEKHVCGSYNFTCYSWWTSFSYLLCYLLRVVGASRGRTYSRSLTRPSSPFCPRPSLSRAIVRSSDWATRS